MNPFARYPFVRYVLPFVCGIVLEASFPISLRICIPLLLFFLAQIILVAYSKWWRSRYKYRFVFATFLQLFWLSFGMTLTAFNNPLIADNYFEKQPQKDYLIVKLQEPLSHKKRAWKALGEVVGVYQGEELKNTQGKIILYFSIDSIEAQQIYCGDELLIQSHANAIEGPKNPGEFDYRNFLANQKIHTQMYLKSHEYVLWKEGNQFEILRNVYRIRDLLLGILAKYIDTKTERGVAGALLFGYKDELDSDIVDAYARTGTLHVLAVSGMHVAILYFVVSFLFRPFQKKKAGAWLTAIFTLVLIWFYSLLSGMAPSISRASVMFSIIILGKTLRDDISIYNNLFTSACLLLCYDPYYLFDAGFQLSYLAVLGIVFFQPKIAPLFIVKSWFGKQVWGLISVSVAAQIATFPISLYYFNQFPNYFIISNLIIIPITTFLMYLGILLLVVNPITFLAGWIGWALGYLIHFADLIILRIQDLPMAVSEGLYIDKFQAFELYLIILLGSVFWVNAYKIYLKLMLWLCFIFMIQLSYLKYQHLQQEAIVINSIRGGFSANIISGNSNILYCDTMVSASPQGMKMHFKGYWNRQWVGIPNIMHDPEFLSNDNYILNKNYLITPNASFYFVDEKLKFDTAPIAIDYLVLRHRCKTPLEILQQTFQFKTLVLDGSLSASRRNKYQQQADSLHCNTIDLLSSGAIEISR